MVDDRRPGPGSERMATAPAAPRLEDLERRVAFLESRLSVMGTELEQLKQKQQQQQPVRPMPFDTPPVRD